MLLPMLRALLLARCCPNSRILFHFFSKKMCLRVQAASVYDREMYAITESVKKWRLYLLGRHFRIYTDQKGLKGLVSQTIQTSSQQKWLTKLLGYDFEI